MVEIKLTNSMTQRKEVFRPHKPEDVRLYLCGPTVYDRAHLGNARPVVVFDVLYRLLRHVFGPDHVTYVRNFTDVDDKINAEALRRQQAGAPGSLEDLIAERTRETIDWYHADMDALGALRPAIRGLVSDAAEPRATAYIPQMIAMIGTLIERGHAYATDGHVLFDVRSYADYGQLSGRSVDDMIAGARVEVAPFKRDPMDFVLWKPSDAQTPGWDSPWGRGRPGWHIECSAMSAALLGESFDIHGGGIDLQFPHHENEIAQSCCAHPHADFARIWLHNEMLQVEGKKMSKSLGNFFTVRDLLDQGIPGEVIRFVFLMTHYRKPMDWTEDKVRETEGTLNRWQELTATTQAAKSACPALIAALSDDLNTAGAIKVLHELARDGKTDVLKASLHFLGFDLTALARTARTGGYESAKKLRDLWADAKSAKDYIRSDIIRAWLQVSGFTLDEKAGGTLKMSDEGEPSGWLTLLKWSDRGSPLAPPDLVHRYAEERGVSQHAGEPDNMPIVRVSGSVAAAFGERVLAEALPLIERDHG